MNPRPDQIKHAIVSFFLTGVFLIPAYWFSWFAYFAPVIAMGFGFYKEFDDRVTTGFDWTDILADAMGIVTALSLWGISSITAR